MAKDSSSIENTKNFKNKLLLYVVFVVFYKAIVRGSIAAVILIALATGLSIEYSYYNYSTIVCLGCAFLLLFMVVGLAVLFSLNDSRLKFLSRTVPKFIKNNPIEIYTVRYSVANYNPYRKMFYLEGDSIGLREVSEKEVTDHLVSAYCKDVYPFKNILNKYLGYSYKYLKHL